MGAVTKREVRVRVAADVETVGLVDVLEGGLPQRARLPIDVEQLTEGAIADFSIRSLNAKKDDASDFYADLLQRSTVGWIASADVQRYFTFLQRVHVPLGSAKLEKWLYDGAAVLLGFYPPIHVRSVAATFEGVEDVRRTQRAALGVLRLALFFFPVLVCVDVGHRMRKRRRSALAPSVRPS